MPIENTRSDVPKLEATLKRRRSLAGPRKRGSTTRNEKQSCIAPDCERPSYARGLCQTHHHQKTTTGRLRPSRPYRKRTAGTVKVAGLRLSQHCANTVRAYAARAGLSLGAAIAEILETWHAGPRKERASDGA
jgi:hypothetical protein